MHMFQFYLLIYNNIYHQFPHPHFHTFSLSSFSLFRSGALESAWAIAFGKDQLNPLSAQQLVDCSTENGGCEGGWMATSYDFIRKNRGICAATSYPYTGKKEECKKGCKRVATVASYVDLSGRTDDALAKAVTITPVAVAVEAKSRGFMFYSKGIISSQCGSNLDHAVYVVGFGTDATKNIDYFLVKNSWGASWGEKGYVRIQKKTGDKTDRKGMCGILSNPCYPIVPKVGEVDLNV